MSRGRHEYLTSNERTEMAAMLHAGARIADVAARFNLSRRTIDTYKERLGLAKPRGEKKPQTKAAKAASRPVPPEPVRYSNFIPPIPVSRLMGRRA